MWNHVLRHNKLHKCNTSKLLTWLVSVKVPLRYKGSLQKDPLSEAQKAFSGGQRPRRFADSPGLSTRRICESRNSHYRNGPSGPYNVVTLQCDRTS